MVQSLHATRPSDRSVSAALAQNLEELFKLPGRLQELSDYLLSEVDGLNDGQKKLAVQLEELRASNRLLQEASTTNRKLQDEFIQQQVREPLAELLIPIIHDIEGVAGSQQAPQVLLGLRDRLIDGLRSLRIRKIEVRTGAEFDPCWMQCMEHRATSERQDHQRVAEVLRSGFAVRGRVIREALVALYKYTTPTLEGGAK